MPTPFYHLSAACDLLAAPDLPDLIADEWAGFCFGNIAPDAQTVSGQTRVATHFFDVPMRDPAPAWRVMFREYPGLAVPARLSPAQAAFVAGYLCHLVLDQLWISEIFEPIFGPAAGWADFQGRLFLHNILRIYLDRLDLPKLQDGLEMVLKQAEPAGWLPFIADEHLRHWRDFVAGQLADGADSQTVSVFAARMSLAPTDFESLLQSPAEMQVHLFDRLPLSALAEYRARGLAGCREAVAEYFSGQKA